MNSCSSLVGLVSSKRRWQRPPNSSRDAEVQADRLGVADMQVAVRLRREPRHHALRAAGIQVGLDDVANEVAAGFGCRRYSIHHSRLQKSDASLHPARAFGDFSIGRHGRVMKRLREAMTPPQRCDNRTYRPVCAGMNAPAACGSVSL